MDYGFLNKDDYRNFVMYAFDEACRQKKYSMRILEKKCNEIIHRHEYFQIIYIQKGKIKHIIDGLSFDAEEGAAFIIPPYIPHKFEARGAKYKMVEFEFMPEFIHEKFSEHIYTNSSFWEFAYLEPFFMAEYNIRPRLILTGTYKKEAEEIFANILREDQEKEEGYELAVKAMALNLLVLLGRRFKKAVNTDDNSVLYERHIDALHNAMGYLDENYQNNIAIDELAKIAMMSSSYFRYIFKEITGKTVGKYINDLRVENACRLLKQSNMAITEIGLEVGYNSISNFNKCFLRTMEVTPRDYRLNAKKRD